MDSLGGLKATAGATRTIRVRAMIVRPAETAVELPTVQGIGVSVRSCKQDAAPELFGDRWRRDSVEIAFGIKGEKPGEAHRGRVEVNWPISGAALAIPFEWATVSAIDVRPSFVRARKSAPAEATVVLSSGGAAVAVQASRCPPGIAASWSAGEGGVANVVLAVGAAARLGSNVCKIETNLGPTEIAVFVAP